MNGQLILPHKRNPSIGSLITSLRDPHTRADPSQQILFADTSVLLGKDDNVCLGKLIVYCRADGGSIPVRSRYCSVFIKFLICSLVHPRLQSSEDKGLRRSNREAGHTPIIELYVRATPIL
jgi:hypothetical protein